MGIYWVYGGVFFCLGQLSYGRAPALIRTSRISFRLADLARSNFVVRFDFAGFFVTVGYPFTDVSGLEVSSESSFQKTFLFLCKNSEV